MGTDKAFLRLGEETLLEHAIATVREVSERAVLVGDRERLGPFGCVVEDRFPGQGPLAGIEAGFKSEFVAQLNLFVAVDTPAVSSELLKCLFTIACESTATVTVPRANGHLQTLCAVYRKEFVTIAEKALQSGRNKIEPLFAQVAVKIIEEDELKAIGFSPDIFDNVNTPEDWQRMQQRFGIIQE